MMADPNWYTIGNAVTSGLFDLVKNVFFPEEAWSLQHLLDILSLAFVVVSFTKLIRKVSGKVKGTKVAGGNPSGTVAEEISGVPDIEYPGNNSSISPGKEWERRGPSDKGSWYNPKTGESLRPDLNHPNPIGPHWDYKDSTGKWFRLNPDGSKIPKH